MNDLTFTSSAMFNLTGNEGLYSDSKSVNVDTDKDIIFQVKAYVIMSLGPAMMVWFVMQTRSRISNPVLKAIVAPVFIATSLIGVVYVVGLLGQYSEKYSVDSVLTTASGMQTWHYVEGDNFADSHGRGSSYSLGEYEQTLTGTLSLFFPAVNVTLFRPYLTEVKSPVMLAAALESLAILLFSIYIAFGLGLFKLLKALNQDPFLLMSLVFAIFFAFAVGFTSYNFGALVRYKIPCIPFYLCSLIILRSKMQEYRAKAKQISRGRSYSRSKMRGS